MKVRVLSSNACQITDGNDVWLQSYDSVIAHWDGKNLTLGKHWDYSQTTFKHLRKFLDYYGITYKLGFSATKPYINRLIDTGEILFDANMY